MNTISVVAIVLLILGSGTIGYLFGSYALIPFFYPSQLSIQNPAWVNSSGEHGSCSWGYTNTFGPWVTCDVTIAEGGSGNISMEVSNSKGAANLAFNDDSSTPLTVFFTPLIRCNVEGTAGFCGIDSHSTGSYFMTFSATPGAYNQTNATLTVVIGVLAPSS